MAEDTPTQQSSQPDAQVRSLDRLVGTWTLTGGTQGTVTYRWMDGRFFLLQDVDMDAPEGRVLGMEVIGREHPFGADRPSEDIKSRFYDSQGNTLDYVYELEGDTLTIWGGEKGSPAYFRGTFTPDGNTVTGAWVYPGGGGYDSVMTRAD